MPPQTPPGPPMPSQRFKDKPAYIPPHAEQVIARHMQRTAPTALGEHVSSPTGPGLNPSASAQLPSQLTAHAPGFHLPRQTDSYRDPLPEQPGQVVSPSGQPSPVLPEQPPGSQLAQSGLPADKLPDAYDFIVRPNEPVRRLLFSLPGGNSLPVRIAFLGGSLLVLVIIIAVIKGLLSGTSNLTPFVGIAQDQQELIHLTTDADKQRNLSIINQDFAATAQLTIGSSQQAIVNYLALNGNKVDAKTLNLKLSASLDAQLTAAAVAATYDQTFQQVMQAELNTYISHLEQSIQPGTGKHGRALINSDIQQAQLLLTQLSGAGQ